MTRRDVWAGARLAALRKARSLSQRELAELANIDRSRFNALERGREAISLTYAERIAPHLEVTPDELLPPPGGPEVGSPDPLARLEEVGERLDRALVAQRELTDQLADLEMRVQKLEAQRRVAPAASKGPQSRSAR